MTTKNTGQLAWSFWWSCQEILTSS